MNLNQQKFKISIPFINAPLQLPKNTNNTTNDNRGPVSACNCNMKLNLLSQQIAKINEKITFIFKIIQIPLYGTITAGETLQAQHKADQNSLKVQQKQFSEQSFLLDGIESDAGLSAKDFIHKPNILIGKEVAEIKEKIKQIQQKSQQFAKFKKNFSLLTKIVDKMQNKMQNDRKSCWTLDEIELTKSKNQSHCSIEQNQRKTIESVKSSQQANSQQRSQKAKRLSQGEIQLRKSVTSKEASKTKNRIRDQGNTKRQ